MVLETILENSGLRKDEEFFIQENTKDEEGKNKGYCSMFRLGLSTK